MTDTSPMPFGKHKGKPLKQVAKGYWEWFIEQDWAKDNWPLLMAYCEEKLARKAPPRKKRECVLTAYPNWVGNPDAANYDDRTIPFDV